MEIWKDVPGYEGSYQVSNLGNVKSLDKTVYQKTRWGCYAKRIYKGTILSPHKNNGYLSVRLSNINKCKTKLVHQLVAMTFLNHKPCGHKLVVDHKNNDKSDNRVENLQIITQRNNASKDRFRHEYTSMYVGVSYAKHRSKWVANLSINGKLKNIGGFENEYDAHLAYQKALKEHENKS